LKTKEGKSLGANPFKKNNWHNQAIFDVNYSDFQKTILKLKQHQHFGVNNAKISTPLLVAKNCRSA
jgi:hypothetical protein